MSQASKYQANRPERERRQLARLLASEISVWWYDGPGPEDRWPAGSDLLLSGDAHFDVPSARAWALDSVDDETVRADQHEDQGRPDAAAVHRRRAREAGRLLEALEGQPGECPECAKWSTSKLSAAAVMMTAEGVPLHVRAGQDVRIVTVSGVFVVGADGQPREAQVGEAFLGVCPACRGSGHNLQGTLPKKARPPVVRRRALEHTTHDLGAPGGRASWVRAMADDERMSSGEHEGIFLGSAWLRKWPDITQSVVHSPNTREGDRGEHRRPSPEQTERHHHGKPVELRDQMRGWIPKGGFGPECWPRWKVGDILHAKHRARRARVYPPEDVAVHLGRGDHLDHIGADVDCPRQEGESDEGYRERLYLVRRALSAPGPVNRRASPSGRGS